MLIHIVFESYLPEPSDEYRQGTWFRESAAAWAYFYERYRAGEPDYLFAITATEYDGPDEDESIDQFIDGYCQTMLKL